MNAAPDITRMADQSLSPAETARLLEENLERQLAAIRASDAKITLLVPTTTAMAGILGAMFRGSGVEGLPALYLVLSAVPVILTYFFMAMALVPRVRKDSGTSILFFGDVSNRSLEEFRAVVSGLTPTSYVEDLTEQCYVTSGIARSKYRHVRRAYLAFFSALPFWALAIYVLSGGA
ncbi:Pycsar system effector family protein [Amaricoccus macauensis]|uniref:Pycsar system effector family protein n=1 Tax=Amaricoccus macauensis TaxID=57001 RepID=UPI003C7ADE66